MSQRFVILVAFIALAPLVWSSVILDSLKATPCKVTDHKEEGPTELSKLIHQCASTEALLFSSAKDVVEMEIPVLQCVSAKFPKNLFYISMNEAVSEELGVNKTEYYSAKIHCPDGDWTIAVGEYFH